MIYVLKLDGDEKVTDIAYTGNEEDVITFLLSNELGQDNDDKRMLELMIRTSFKDGVVTFSMLEYIIYYTVQLIHIYHRIKIVIYIIVF